MHHFLHDDPTFVARSRSTWDILRRVAVYLRPYKLMAAGTVSGLFAGLRAGLSEAHPIRY
jgi:hypothetical protein